VRGANRHKLWLKKVILLEGKVGGLVGIVFTDDNDLLRINQEFLKHNYFTDVITFDFSDENCIQGELYISVDSVVSNAGLYGVRKTDELRRVMVHGILHLCGYKDNTDEHVAEMRERENRYLKLYSDEFHI